MVENKEEKKEAVKKEDVEMDMLKIELKEKDEKLKELTDMLQRLQAEFENYNKRVEKENSEFRKYAKAELIKKLLPVLESFELALRNNQCCGKDNEKMMKGMEMIYTQLFQTLEDEGLRGIECLGKKFDPFRHEVLMTEHIKEKGDGVVIEELQKGYMVNDKVLRYSKVKINKKEDGKNANKE
jgi:molecular chaperone GrpE